MLYKSVRLSKISYYEFSDSDLDSYLILINEQEQNQGEFITWVISNEKYLKSQGKSDLAISELIKELRSLKERLRETKLKVANIQNIRNNLEE